MTHPAEPPELQTLKLSLDAGVARLTLHRPARANALNMTMWQELRAAMGWISATPAARACILDAAGGHFCAGIDLSMLEVLRAPDASGCEGRSHERLLHSIRDLQDCVNSIERCAKPVIAAIHGACVGGGIDLVTACDLRYCGPAAWFSVKEIDVGIVADVGTLQRLPRIVGEGVARVKALRRLFGFWEGHADARRRILAGERDPTALWPENFATTLATTLATTTAA